jgi:hypothetical protein
MYMFTFFNIKLYPNYIYVSKDIKNVSEEYINHNRVCHSIIWLVEIISWAFAGMLGVNVGEVEHREDNAMH